MAEDKEIRRLLRAAQAHPDDPRRHIKLALGLQRGGRMRDAYQACYRALMLDDSLFEAEASSRRLFRAFHGVELSAEERVSKITAALQLSEPYRGLEREGYFEVLGVAKDPVRNRVGWIEQHFVGSPQAFYLKVAEDGDLIHEAKVPSYNPYFGVAVGHMHWWGHTLFSVYREKHETILWALTFEGEETHSRLLPISDRWFMLNDLLLYESREKGLLSLLSLPDCQLALPLPFEFRELPYEQAFGFESDELVVHERSGDGFGRYQLPSTAQKFLGVDPLSFQKKLEQRLFKGPSPQPLADVIIGSLAFPFWFQFQTSSESYGFQRCWNSPYWLSVYWWQHLMEKDQEQGRSVIRQLEALARELPEEGWKSNQTSEDGALELAERHVRRQAGVLLKTCQNDGKLPESEWCHFWAPWSQTLFALDLHRFPKGFRSVYYELFTLAPKSLSSR